jgi:hypothetical protein
VTHVLGFGEVPRYLCRWRARTRSEPMSERVTRMTFAPGTHAEFSKTEICRNRTDFLR